jgi:phosphoserine aminotransferase
VLAGLIISHTLLDFVLHMVIIALQQAIDERISFLKEQINPENRPQVNKTFQLQIDELQIDAIRSVDD